MMSLPQNIDDEIGLSAIVGEFVKIEPGEFIMGSGKQPFERPAHKVIISRSFEISKYQVTQAQWQAVMGNNPSAFKGADLPVEMVSWDDAQLFINQLNSKSSKYIYSLPTEAQWEYACRAGTTTQYAGKLDNMGWYNKNSDRKTHPVGQKKPNAWGLYDMHGNVWEWCQNWFYLYSSETAIDPTGPMPGPGHEHWMSDRRIYRGGGYNFSAARCRSATREGYLPHYRFSWVGFRLSRHGL